MVTEKRVMCARIRLGSLPHGGPKRPPWERPSGVQTHSSWWMNMQPVQEGFVSDIGRSGVLLPRASPASDGEAADCRYRDRSDEPRGQHSRQAASREGRQRMVYGGLLSAEGAGRQTLDEIAPLQDIEDEQGQGREDNDTEHEGHVHTVLALVAPHG